MTDIKSDITSNAFINLRELLACNQEITNSLQHSSCLEDGSTPTAQ
jgi:hypothetical protein